MTHRIAFAGFRHPHIHSLWRVAKAHPDIEITAAWESDAATREQLSAAGEVTITHENYSDLLAPGVCDIIAIGAVYAERGALAIAALEAGKHVISDKPICTDLAELEKIEGFAREKGLMIGCQLDLVEHPSVRKLQSLIRENHIGRVCTITISAQHPLRYGTRAAWYFEPGQHGGTINDIGIHVFHLAPWLTGSQWEKTLLSRTWNAKAAATPHFQDCAQFYGVLENNIACFADVSYLAPDQTGYDLPNYWRITVHGTRGMCEISYGSSEVIIATDQDSARRIESPATDTPRGYLKDFLDEIHGAPSAEGLTSNVVLTASRLALEAQQIADKGAKS